MAPIVYLPAMAHKKLKNKQNTDAILQVEDVNTVLANF